MQASLATPPSETKPHYKKLRFCIAAASVLAYLLLFLGLPVFFRFTGMPILAVIPVITIAWLYGARAGMLAGLLCFPVNAVMMKVAGFGWIHAMLTSGGGIAGHLGFLFIALVVGSLSDLQVRLRGELLARQEAEQELGHYRDDLERLAFERAQELLETQERFKAIAENSPDAICITDATGIILYCNKGAETMFGYRQAEVLGQNSVIFMPPRMREAELLKRESLARAGVHVSIAATIESDMVRRDGREFPVEFSLFSWRLHGESFFSMSIRDITQRRQTESALKSAAESLRRSRDFFYNVFNAAGDGIYVTDEIGDIVFANRALCAMLGYEYGELVGMPALGVYIVEDDDQEADRIFSLDYTEPFTTLHRRKDGSSMAVECRLTNVQEDGQAAAGVIVVLRDITERKLAEEQIRQARDFLETMFRTSPDAIIAMDELGHVTAASDSVYDVYGYRPEELIGQHASVLPNDDEESMRRNIFLVEQVYEHGIVRGFESTKKHKAGHSIRVETSVALLKNQDGTVAGAISSTRDITERKRLEEQLQRSRDFFLNVFNVAGDGMYVTDELGGIIFANRALCAMLGYELDELIGRPAVVLSESRSDLSFDEQAVSAMYSWNYADPFETVYFRKDGTSLLVESRLTNVQEVGQTGAGIIVVLRDITERKRLEEQLQRSRDYLEKVFMASPDAIVVCDDTGNIIMANDSVYDVYGYRPEELIGEHGSIFTPMDQKQAEGMMEALEELFEKGVLRSVPSDRQHKGGHRILAESSHVLLKNQDGTVVGSVSSTRDISERRRMEEQLRQSQKMEAIGTLAGGIAHDFNNILGAIIGYTELSQYETNSPRLQNNLAQVLKAADRARNLVKQILAFSRKSQNELRPLQVHLVLKEVLKLLRASISAQVEIRTDITADSDMVVADPTQIHQIIVNLCTNAAHAMEKDGGVMTIALKPVVLQDADIAAFSDIRPGPYAQLSVKDTGTGMDAAIISRIFEPFFTTKDVGKGTGMGLAVVHGIVKSLNGDIKVYSELGRGSVFHVLLPRVQDAVAYSPDAESQPSRGHERVLLVDDEAALIDVVANMLQSLGYHVTAVQSSLEALELFANDPAAFDLVFTDQAMPALTGFELAGRILALRPGIPVILCTGYSDLVTEDAALAAGIKAFVIKPLSRLDIGKTIREVLGRTAVS